MGYDLLGPSIPVPKTGLNLTHDQAKATLIKVRRLWELQGMPLTFYMFASLRFILSLLIHDDSPSTDHSTPFTYVSYGHKTVLGTGYVRGQISTLTYVMTLPMAYYNHLWRDKGHV